MPRSSRTAGLLLLLALAAPVGAHPVPRDNHDRTVVVRLTADAVLVDYRLELDETRAALDLPRSEQANVRSPRDFYAVFTRYFAPKLAYNLVADLDGKPLEFTCVERRHELSDHLRCDYRFRAEWKPAVGQPHTFRLNEANDPRDDFSRLELRLGASPRVTFWEVIVPSDEVIARSNRERLPGDSDRLRTVSVRFVVSAEGARGWYKAALPPDPELPRTPTEGDASAVLPAAPPGAEVALAKPLREEAAGAEGEAHRSHKLLYLLLDTRQGFVVLLLLAAGFGAVHALTPGHGKTMVAAYLIGEQGTVWNALLLGLVVTLTHTSAVLLLAALLPRFFPHAVPATIQTTLGLVGGLLIAGLGLWLLLRRLSGQADHFHLGGGHHHGHGHSHEPLAARESLSAVVVGPDHAHGPGEAVRPVGWWGVVVLGVSGGIVPCWDAIAMLCVAVSAQRLWLGLPLLLAFSAGLAAVLIALGLSVVYARKWAGGRWGGKFHRVVRALPLASAALITVMGLWLCYDSFHPDAEPPAAARPVSAPSSSPSSPG
jgi:ABC-type nickel/cobalt efflux system permease component RcnA